MMTRRQVIALAATALAPSVLPHPARSQEVTPVDFAMLARRRAFEAARRLATDGWKVRDQPLVQHLEPRASHTCPVHLIGGVEYVFLATVRPVEGRLQMRLLNEEGTPLAPPLPENETKLQAVWLTSPITQRALLEFSVPWDAAAGDFAALYLYR